jgi:hypothetical protein
MSFSVSNLFDDDDYEDRPVDQIYCKDCGRPMVIWADIDLQESDLICGRCKRGLAPEWEY